MSDQERYLWKPKDETSREKGTIISVTDKKVEDGIETLPLVRASGGSVETCW